MEINSTLVAKASENLTKTIEKELEIPDPEPESWTLLTNSAKNSKKTEKKSSKQ
jgi:hypothetical protein